MTSFLKRLFGVSADRIAKFGRAKETHKPQPPEQTTAFEQTASGGVYLTGNVITVGGDVVGGNRYHEFSGTVTNDAALITSNETATELLRRRAVATHDEGASHLKAWTCSKCGASLPESSAERITLKCASCGTVFWVSQTSTSHSGGVNFNGGTITVSGEIVGGDKIVIVSDGNSIA